MPEGIYQVTTEQFQGPFDKLLELIEDKKLDITRVSLNKVTGDFVAYVKSIEQSRPALLADFLVVAAKLLLIKSKALLPEFKFTPEEEEEMGDFERRLKLYRAYREASGHIEELYGQGGHFYGKKYLQGLEGGFFPADNVTSDILWSAVSTVFEILQEFVLEQETMKFDEIRLEDKIGDVLNRLQERVSVAFGEMSEHASRSEIIVLFLAILHLHRHGHARTEQNELFGDIQINRISESADIAPGGELINEE